MNKMNKQFVWRLVRANRVVANSLEAFATPEEARKAAWEARWADPHPEYCNIVVAAVPAPRPSRKA